MLVFRIFKKEIKGNDKHYNSFKIVIDKLKELGKEASDVYLIALADYLNDDIQGIVNLFQNDKIQ